MKRIEYIEKVFSCFSFYKTALAIVHVNGEKGKAGFPLIVEPAASDYRLGGFVAAEPVHDQQKYKTPPAIVCVQKIGDSQKSGYA